jgi:SpoVK/Ycf46/Vps4 family AAA+-type ATPase
MRLIERDDEGLYTPLRASAAITARLLDRPYGAPTPPGAVAVHVRAGWDELVLPPDRITALREFLAWVHQLPTIVTQWRARDHGGPVALFAGPSGTGKTFAAAVLATELGWPLYRVDLGLLVSKYIGETEKNLNRLFDAVDGEPAVLQFDEADSLFGRRGEVRDARDRYANLEVSHLLARIEHHHGPCVLTTNLRRHLDPAFARRFQVVLDFPRPDAPARARLWRLQLPPQAPLDAALDLEKVGAAVTLTGGGIRNAAMHAAVLAATDGRPIGPEHIALAAWRELAKDGRDLQPVALGALLEHLPVAA